MFASGERTQLSGARHLRVGCVFVVFALHFSLRKLNILALSYVHSKSGNDNDVAHKSITNAAINPPQPVLIA